MSSSSSSSATASPAQPHPQQTVRIVHRPAAPELGPLKRPHSDWRAEPSRDREDARGRSGRRRALAFDMPTTSAPIPIPVLRRSLSTASSSSSSASFESSGRSIPSVSASSRHHSLAFTPSASSSFFPSSPPAYDRVSPISQRIQIQVNVRAATRSTSSIASSGGSYDSSAYFDDRSEDEDEEVYDSSASSSAFSFIDGEEMEGVEEEGDRGVDPVTVRRPSDGDVVMMDESASFVNDTYHSLHFARKPSLSNSNSPQHPFASLPHDGAELAFLSRQAQAKAPHRKGVRPAPRWMMGGGVSV